MLILDIKYYLDQLERIFAELNAGKHVLLTHRGRPYEELIPMASSQAGIAKIIQTNRDRGWRGSRATKIVLVYNQEPMALILRHTRCRRLQQISHMMDDILANPARMFDAITYFAKLHTDADLRFQRSA